MNQTPPPRTSTTSERKRNRPSYQSFYHSDDPIRVPHNPIFEFSLEDDDPNDPNPFPQTQLPHPSQQHHHQQQQQQQQQHQSQQPQSRGSSGDLGRIGQTICPCPSSVAAISPLGKENGPNNTSLNTSADTAANCELEFVSQDAPEEEIEDFEIESHPNHSNHSMNMNMNSDANNMDVNQMNFNIPLSQNSTTSSVTFASVAATDSSVRMDLECAGEGQDGRGGMDARDGRDGRDASYGRTLGGLAEDESAGTDCQGMSVMSGVNCPNGQCSVSLESNFSNSPRSRMTSNMSCIENYPPAKRARMTREHENFYASQTTNSFNSTFNTSGNGAFQASVGSSSLLGISSNQNATKMGTTVGRKVEKMEEEKFKDKTACCHVCRAPASKSFSYTMDIVGSSPFASSSSTDPPFNEGAFGSSSASNTNSHGPNPNSSTKNTSLLSYFRQSGPKSVPKKQDSIQNNKTPNAQPPSSSSLGSFGSMNQPLIASSTSRDPLQIAAPNLSSCRYCDKLTCHSCTRQCEQCQHLFCTFCSKVDYNSVVERILCFECDEKVERDGNGEDDCEMMDC